MSDPLEAAVEALKIAAETKTTFEEDVVEVLKAWLRAAIGCPQCDGTRDVGWLDGNVRRSDSGYPCTREHVEIPFMGETIWADPDKCEWRCGYSGSSPEPACKDSLKLVKDHDWYRPESHGKELANKPVGFHSANYDGDEELRWRAKYGCGWQPRWTAITGGDVSQEVKHHWR